MNNNDTVIIGWNRVDLTVSYSNIMHIANIMVGYVKQIF